MPNTENHQLHLILFLIHQVRLTSEERDAIRYVMLALHRTVAHGGNT